MCGARSEQVGEERLTTPSSATAERGAVAAWSREVKAYELEKKVARTRRVRTRNSSYRDTRSRSLQRMVSTRAGGTFDGAGVTGVCAAAGRCATHPARMAGAKAGMPMVERQFAAYPVG